MIFLKNHCNILLSGKKIIEVIGPRGKALEISNVLNNKYCAPSDGYISISSLELLDLWIDNAHPLLNKHHWHGDSLDFNYSHIYWPILNGKGWIARCFFLYPIMLALPNRDIHFTGTIDSSLVTSCGYNKNDAAIITNSQELFCCELSDVDKNSGKLGIRGSINSIVNSYKPYENQYNTELLKETIILGHRYDDAAIKKTIYESNGIINRILSEL